MQSLTSVAAWSPSRLKGWQLDLVGSLLATLIILTLQAASGFKTLSDIGSDNDSLMRLVEVRDLIAGQGWFDLHQYRMGPAGGFVMHWSRLVDAPIAVIILAVAAVTGSQAAGETAAMIVWPLALYGVALFLLLRITRRLAGDEATFPALIIGATTLHFTGIFVPGALDHHNIQLVLTLATVLSLLKASPENRSAWWAGIFAMLMLAIGMETAPFVAVAGLFVAAWFLLEGEEASSVAVGFGIAFAATSAAVLVTTVPSGEWADTHCDAFSVAQFVAGALGGAGLAVIAATPTLKNSLAKRALSLAVLGGVVAGVALVFFPQCLDDPYSGVGSVLRTYWLDSVGEAQPLWSILAKEPETAPGHYFTVLIALVVLALRMRRNGLRREELLVGLFLATAFAVSIWQLRGSRFSVPLACVPLAIWVAEWRRRSQVEPGLGSSLKLVGAWLASLNVAWMMAALAVWFAFSPQGVSEAAAVVEKCQKGEDYAELAAMPPQGVLVISNLGAPVLRYTSHRVLAGPYHRNIEGNLAVLDAFVGPAGAAAEIARRNDLALVALCRGNGESKFFAARARDGLMAALLEGKTPAWLEIMPESRGKPLELYRVLPPGATSVPK